jgi:hypothetical protein
MTVPVEGSSNLEASADNRSIGRDSTGGPYASALSNAGGGESPKGPTPPVISLPKGQGREV